MRFLMRTLALTISVHRLCGLPYQEIQWSTNKGSRIAEILAQEGQEPFWAIGNIEEEELEVQDLFSFYGYNTSDALQENEVENSESETPQPFGNLHQAPLSTEPEQMSPSLTSGGSAELSPRFADSPEEWTLETEMRAEEVLFGSEPQLPYLRYTPNSERGKLCVTKEYIEGELPENCGNINKPDFQDKDQLLWDPSVLPEREVENYLMQAAEYQIRNGGAYDQDESVVKDNEQGNPVQPKNKLWDYFQKTAPMSTSLALYELVKCRFHTEEALRRLRFNVKVVQGPLCAWSEDECRSFEQGFKVYGKNFHLIQANKVRTRSVGECVQFYYSWKKSERYENFTQGRMGRRKQLINSASLDYECDVPNSECQFGLRGSELNKGIRGGSKKNASQYSNCPCSKDKSHCRLHTSICSNQEDHQSSSPHSEPVSLDLHQSEVPSLPDARKQNHPLGEYNLADLPLPNFLSRPSFFCTDPFSS